MQIPGSCNQKAPFRWPGVVPALSWTRARSHCQGQQSEGGGLILSSRTYPSLNASVPSSWELNKIMCVKFSASDSDYACVLLISQSGDPMAPAPLPSSVQSGGSTQYSQMSSSPHWFSALPQETVPFSGLIHWEAKNLHQSAALLWYSPDAVRSGTGRGAPRSDGCSVPSSFVSLEMNDHLIPACKGLNFCSSSL